MAHTAAREENVPDRLDDVKQYVRNAAFSAPVQRALAGGRCWREVPVGALRDGRAAPDGEGTLLRLVHRGVPVERRGGSAEGWTHYLGRLVIVAGGSDPGPDPWAADPTSVPTNPIGRTP